MDFLSESATRKSIGEPDSADQVLSRFHAIRQATEALCESLELEDYVIQSMPDVSPTKWHLGHTTWFFETFVLGRARPRHRPHHSGYAVLFNSYYNTVGPQHPRPERGLLSRPTVGEVMAYRAVVDAQVDELLSSGGDAVDGPLLEIVELGLQHEQQHQELMLMDIKHVFWCNPLRPVYSEAAAELEQPSPELAWQPYEEDLLWIGHEGEGFSYDNESPRHRRIVEGFDLANRLATCGEYLEFIEEGGYARPELWLSDGWRTVQDRGWSAPLYWQREGDVWHVMTLAGMRPVGTHEPVCHASYFEADAFARWAGATLASEAAWETVACDLPIEGNFVESGRYHPAVADAEAANGGVAQMYGDLWEWTSSPYTPYPGYRAADGALGEYNGKFMCNQMMLRGGCCATPISHIRATYRNFYPPDARWPFTGIRLAKHLT